MPLTVAYTKLLNILHDEYKLWRTSTKADDLIDVFLALYARCFKTGFRLENSYKILLLNAKLARLRVKLRNKTKTIWMSSTVKHREKQGIPHWIILNDIWYKQSSLSTDLNPWILYSAVLIDGYSYWKIQLEEDHKVW